MTPATFVPAARPPLVDIVLDEEKLADLRASLGDAALRTLIDLMLQDIPPRVKSILSAMAASQPRLASRQAHALRGAASGVGAVALAGACSAIEQLDPLAPSPLRLAWIAEQACDALRRLRDQLSTSSD
ncbi:MAG: hypothetical protein C0500_04020 [Sphingobium sp.]|nr:hypothetical protein [Sphingobium sp.]